MSYEDRLLSALSGLQIEIYYVIGYTEDLMLKVQREISEGSEHNSETVNNPMLMGGTGGQGVFMVPEIGSGIICAKDDSSQAIIAIGCIPSSFQSSGNASRLDPPDDMAPATVPYPIMDNDSTHIQSKSGCSFYMNKDGIGVNTPYNQGTKYVLNRTGVVKQDILDSSNTYTNAGYKVSGPVRRASGYGLKKKPAGDNNMGVDALRVLKEHVIGLFNKTKTAEVVINNRPKNPERVETRMVYNQMGPTFKGYDVYQSNYLSDSPAELDSSEEVRQNIAHDSNAICNLAPSQLIEIIAGNLINPYGECLDSNFEPINFGESGRVPVTDPDDSFSEAAELERRAIGYMFQLDTNVNSGEYSNNRRNFVYTINKEGFVTLNIPSSSDSGVVYKNNLVTFWDGFNGFEYDTDINYTSSEAIPIVNMYDGNPIPNLTKVGVNEASKDRRLTGIYHANLNQYSADSNKSSIEGERVHFTRWHNMPAAGEMLFANKVKDICIPTFWTDPDSGHPEGLSIMKAFEYISKTDGSLINDNAKEPVSYMTLLSCFHDNPAIDPGYNPFIVVEQSPYCGKGQDKISAGAYSNSFKFDKNLSEDSAVFDEDTQRTGGKSANINLEGSIEMSVGSDNSDGKSMVLDLAGSIVAWFGSDKNNRSAVIQTDGDVAINVGGYNGDQFNAGRFDLRVNVTDKGTLESSGPENTGEFPWTSDYLISIGPHGLVIAGMADKPLLIRNKSDLCLESSEGKILLSAFDGVKYVEGGGPMRDLSSKPGERNAKEVSPGQE